MKLTNMLLNNLSVSTDLNADVKPEKVRSNKKNGFDSFMNEASKDNKVNTAKRDDNTRQENVVKRSSDKKVNKDKTKTRDSDAKDQVKRSQKDDGKETEAAEIEKIAAELNVEPERVMEILLQLNITIEDLAAKPEMLTDVLVEAFNVESPIDLLNIPNVRDVMSNLKDILANNQQVDTELVVESGVVEVDNTETGDVVEVAVDVSKALNEKSLKEGLVEEAVEANVKGEEKSDTQSKSAVNQGEVKSATAVAAVGQSESSNSGFNQESTNNFIPVAVPVSNSSEARTTFLRTEVFKNVNPQDIIKQMTETLKTDIRNGVSEIKIILKPEQLGDITLKLLTENGIITAKFVAESERVKEIIESNFDQLRDALKEQGISVSELSVSVGQEDSSDRMQQFLKEQQKSSARIRQIINGINGSDDVESEQVNDNLTDSNVDFTA